MLLLLPAFLGSIVRACNSATAVRCLSVSCVKDAQVSARKGRGRQHVNPLSWSYQQPITLAEDWVRQSFEQPALPFLVDIGPAKGTACVRIAELNRKQNVLGLEIRKPMVHFAMQRKEASKLNNLHFLAGNANVDLDRILKDIHRLSHVDMITIHFPDPHFKTRNQKRRTVTPLLVQTMAMHLRPGTVVSLRSDVLDLLKDMHGRFKACERFEFAGENEEDFTQNPPVPLVKTEREIATEAKHMPVYRTLFRLK